jgi:hypothetical protein
MQVIRIRHGTNLPPHSVSNSTKQMFHCSTERFATITTRYPRHETPLTFETIYSNHRHGTAIRLSPATQLQHTHSLHTIGCTLLAAARRGSKYLLCQLKCLQCSFGRALICYLLIARGVPRTLVTSAACFALTCQEDVDHLEDPVMHTN